MRKMKDSGVEWIGEIPENWQISKPAFFFDIQLGKMLQPVQQRETETLETYLCAANIGNSAVKYEPVKQMWFSDAEKELFGLENGDLLVVEGGDVASCAIVDKDVRNLYFQNALHRVRSKGSTDIRILKYMLITAKNSGYIDLICNKATIAHFPKEKFLSMPFISMPCDEQNEIADYLDAKCAKIDAIIAKQQEIIEKLKAYKLSVITEAVSPKTGWVKGHLGYISVFKNGLNYSGMSTDAQIKFLGVGDFGNHFRMNNPNMFSTLEFNGEMPEELLLKNGDIVFVRSNGSKELVGRSVLIDNIDFPLAYSGFCIRMRNLRQDIVLNEFLLYCFWSNDFRQRLNQDSRGSNINNLNQGLLSKLEIAFPDILEQKQIISMLDKKCSDIEIAISEKKASVIHTFRMW